MAKLKPLADKIIIEKSAEETVTKSGIVLPENAKEKPQTGKVIAVGSGKVTDNGTKIGVIGKVLVQTVIAKHKIPGLAVFIGKLQRSDDPSVIGNGNF